MIGLHWVARIECQSMMGRGNGAVADLLGLDLVVPLARYDRMGLFGS